MKTVIRLHKLFIKIPAPTCIRPRTSQLRPLSLSTSTLLGKDSKVQVIREIFQFTKKLDQIFPKRSRVRFPVRAPFFVFFRHSNYVITTYMIFEDQLRSKLAKNGCLDRDSNLGPGEQKQNGFPLHHSGHYRM